MKISLYFSKRRIKTGNILATNSISIFKIGKLLPENFTVDFNTSEYGKLFFTPKIKNNGFLYNDIYCKISNTDGLRLVKEDEATLGDYSENFNDFYKIQSGQTWDIINMSLSKREFTLYFEVRNKTTGEVMLTKSFNCVVNLASDSKVTGGTINGEEDPNFNTSNFFDGINEHSSLQDIINSVKDTFTMFQLMFSIVPGFIWFLVFTGITVCIALRILGR